MAVSQWTRVSPGRYGGYGFIILLVSVVYIAREATIVRLTAADRWTQKSQSQSKRWKFEYDDNSLQTPTSSDDDESTNESDQDQSSWANKVQTETQTEEETDSTYSNRTVLSTKNNVDAEIDGTNAKGNEQLFEGDRFNFTELQELTIDFVQSRRKSFEDKGFGINWWIRGLGYLWEMQQMALAMPSISRSSDTPVVVKILNVHPNATGRNCSLLHIWVRVRGPEIVADIAKAVVDNATDTCHWEFQADVRVPGTYHVDAKVLSWNMDDINPDKRTCSSSFVDEIPKELQNRTHAGVKGFKMYGPAKACCEYCSRIPGCTHWATPPLKMQNPSFFHNGCEFFFDRSTRRIPRSYLLHDLNTTWSSEEVYRHRRKRRLGAPNGKYELGRTHTDKKVYFVGCGWNQMFTLDFPCMSGDLDDKVYATNNTFVLDTSEDDPPSEPLPLCALPDEFDGQRRGRWVRQPWPEDCPRFTFDKKFNTKFLITSWTGDQPHCWHRDDMTVVGHRCIEPNCQFIRSETKYVSPMRTNKWMGVFRDRKCDYYEYTDQQLQRCFTFRKIQKVELQGKSIAEFIFEYIQQRMSNITMYSGEDGVTLISSTLTLLHKSTLSKEELRVELNALPLANATDSELTFVPSPFFLSSERDTLAIQENMKIIFDEAKKSLLAKGYPFFNVMEASAAWTFDTATQFDGMHITGAPVKLAVTKLFHYLCKDVVEGSRM